MMWSLGMERFLPILLEGALISAQVAAGALVLATMLGLRLALFSLGKNRLLYWFARSWIELIRGTPALTQLFILYFGLADFGLQMPPIVAAIVGLGINGSAYLAEIFRSACVLLRCARACNSPRGVATLFVLFYAR